MQRVKALIDCCVTRIFISPSLLRKLELPREPAFTSTLGLIGQVMMSAKERRNASLLVQIFEPRELVDKSEVLVVPMKVYDRVLGLPWFQARYTEIDWTQGRFPTLQTPNGPQWTKIPEADRTSPLPERGEENTNDETPPNIQLLGATAHDHLVANEEVVAAFAIQLGECPGLLGASLEGITKGERNPRMLNAQAGAAALVVAED